MSDITKCIICLENDPINNDSGGTYYEVLPIPCECKIYCHQHCFDKIEKKTCFICKKPYDLEKYSGSNILSFDNSQIESNILMTFDEITNERTEKFDHMSQCLKIITFGCIPPLSLLVGILIVWVNGMVTNMIFCLFFNSFVDKCFLSYDNILVFVIGFSSLTFWFLIYKIVTSTCCKKM